MKGVTIYSPKVSNRLRYVLDWLFIERLSLNYVLVHDMHRPCDLYYGTPQAMAISIPDAQWLWRTYTGNGHATKQIALGHWHQLPILFASGEQQCDLPFDLFSALFFLLSREEEYYETVTDNHGRYLAIQSILYKMGVLERPIIDEWVLQFARLLEERLDIVIQLPRGSFTPTYDIDIAYSHSYKGFARIAGAYCKALIKGDMQQILEKVQVMKKRQIDPYDSFAWIHSQHEALGMKPIYFILCALKTTAFDKNIHPKHPAMVRIIKQMAREGAIGIHPSYMATKAEVLKGELHTLEEVLQQDVFLSRQHYIKLHMPSTYKLLLSLGVKEDYSMGYGKYLGFRAGTGSSFLWYNLETESVTSLRVHPFCFMDTTAHFEQRLTAKEAFAIAERMYATLVRTGSNMHTIMHNFSLGTANEWIGWQSAYADFLQNRKLGYVTP